MAVRRFRDKPWLRDAMRRVAIGYDMLADVAEQTETRESDVSDGGSSATTSVSRPHHALSTKRSMQGVGQRRTPQRQSVTRHVAGEGKGSRDRAKEGLKKTCAQACVMRAGREGTAAGGCCTSVMEPERRALGAAAL